MGSDTSAAALIEGDEVFVRHDFLLARRGHLANKTHDTVDNPSAEVVGGDPLLHDSFLPSLWLLVPRVLMPGRLATVVAKVVADLNATCVVGNDVAALRTAVVEGGGFHVHGFTFLLMMCAGEPHMATWDRPPAFPPIPRLGAT